MNFDEWHDQAGRAAYEKAFLKHAPADAPRWGDIDEAARESWREVARAVLAEGKIEVRPSAELAEAATREENERLIKIARERAEDAQSYRDAADELRSKLAGLRRAYDHACAQRDKYMRRTAEWRSAALEGHEMPDDIVKDVQWALSELGQEHWDSCDIPDEEDGGCYVCNGYKELKEKYPEVKS